MSHQRTVSTKPQQSHRSRASGSREAVRAHPAVTAESQRTGHQRDPELLQRLATQLGSPGLTPLALGSSTFTAKSRADGMGYVISPTPPSFDTRPEHVPGSFYSVLPSARLLSKVGENDRGYVIVNSLHQGWGS